jgi:hypothetical protein
VSSQSGFVSGSGNITVQQNRRHSSTLPRKFVLISKQKECFERIKDVMAYMPAHISYVCGTTLKQVTPIKY